MKKIISRLLIIALTILGLFMTIKFVRYYFKNKVKQTFEVDRYESVENESFLADYLPAKRSVKTQNDIEIFLSDAFLYQVYYIEDKFFYKEQNNANWRELHMMIFSDSLGKRVLLSSTPDEYGLGNRTFRNKGYKKNGFRPGYSFIITSRNISDTIMIYLFEKEEDEYGELYPNPSDSVAYIRVK